MCDQVIPATVIISQNDLIACLYFFSYRTCIFGSPSNNVCEHNDAVTHKIIVFIKRWEFKKYISVVVKNNTYTIHLMNTWNAK